MFTGLIEEIGTVNKIQPQGESSRLVIISTLDNKVGDSIAVSGVCLTVVEQKKGEFEADMVKETLNRTTFHKLRVGEKVNLERALKMHDRFGGHFVLGHIDGVGTIRKYIRRADTLELGVSFPAEMRKYFVEKGSVTVDGISLTVAKVQGNTISLAVIPHTAEVTTLGIKKVGDEVNLETDIIGKYVESLKEYGRI